MVTDLCSDSFKDDEIDIVEEFDELEGAAL
jgi:hypothetical protein